MKTEKNILIAFLLNLFFSIIEIIGGILTNSISILSDAVSDFLPILDNLEKALEAKTEDENYKQGIELVLKQFKDVLASKGVKEIEAVGKTFDPELHEAVGSVVDENLGEKEIKQEYRKGYIIGNRVIRHSMVIVAN